METVSNLKHRDGLPAEWEKQDCVLLSWPRANGLWDNYLDAIERSYIEIVRHIRSRQKVVILCFDDLHFRRIVYSLFEKGISNKNIHFHSVQTDDVWIRDYGPLLVFEKGLPKFLDFRFNAWGNKYPGDQDNAATRLLSEQKALGDIPIESIDLVLEGGSIEVDGQGTLLTTSRCLLAKTRNPQLTREQLIEKLKSLLGINRVLWLEHGHLAGDDTDGHIDTLARFVDPHTICHVSCDDPNDAHFSDIHAMVQELKTFVDYQGNPYRLIALPWPRPQFKENGQRLPATYANFLIINGAVLMPSYEDPADALALKQLQHCFPDREIIGIPCSPVIRNYGSLHCITMQVPAV